MTCLRNLTWTCARYGYHSSRITAWLWRYLYSYLYRLFPTAYISCRGLGGAAEQVWYLVHCLPRVTNYRRRVAWATTNACMLLPS